MVCLEFIASKNVQNHFINCLLGEQGAEEYRLFARMDSQGAVSEGKGKSKRAEIDFHQKGVEGCRKSRNCDFPERETWLKSSVLGLSAGPQNRVLKFAIEIKILGCSPPKAFPQNGCRRFFLISKKVAPGQ